MDYLCNYLHLKDVYSALVSQSCGHSASSPSLALLLQKCTSTKSFVKFKKGIKFKRAFKYKPQTNILKEKGDAQLPSLLKIPGRETAKCYRLNPALESDRLGVKSQLLTYICVISSKASYSLNLSFLVYKRTITTGYVNGSIKRYRRNVHFGNYRSLCQQGKVWVPSLYLALLKDFTEAKQERIVKTSERFKLNLRSLGFIQL